MSSKQTKATDGNSSGESSTAPSHLSAVDATSTSLQPTRTELDYAATTLSWALGILGVTKFGFIGGSTVAIFAAAYGLHGRQTDDLDVIIQPTTMTADIVSRDLTTNEAVKEHFISKLNGYVHKPHVIVTQGEETIYIPVEIFDWRVWPDREKYYNLDRIENAPETVTIDNKEIPILSPGWLLRQKILAYAQRKSRNLSDMDDIRSLKTVLTFRHENITITDDSEVEALKTVLDNPNPPDLKGIVLCEAVWPTQ